MREGTLVASNIRGRYALNTPDGPDITGGQVCEILLGGQWIRGAVEHTGKLYADEGSAKPRPGYYFEALNGGICGLCTGMTVRIQGEQEDLEAKQHGT